MSTVDVCAVCEREFAPFDEVDVILDPASLVDVAVHADCDAQ
jgi:hypothetical protein